jgi:hypothetical protein
MCWATFWAIFSPQTHLVTLPLVFLVFHQGDQIGRIFAHRGIVYFGQFF